jgi:hypothetical protein
MFKKTFLLLSAFTLGLGGCTSLSPIAITLTDLGTASTSEHSMDGLSVMRTVNITSLGPTEVIGSMSVDPDPPSIDIFPNFMAKADYPDTLSFRLSPECSRIVETTFPKVDVNDVVTVRDGIQELVELVSNKIALEVKQVILLNVSENLADKTRDHTELLKILQAQYSADKLSNEAEVNAALQSVNIKLEAIQQKITQKRETLKKAQNASGIIVTRWTQERKKKGALDAMKALAMESSSSSQQEGFLVLGNPRVTSLILGDDILAEFTESDEKCKSWACIKMKTLFQAKRTYVTYYQLSAEHVAWGEVRSGTSNKVIQADISKIASTIHPYLKGANFATLLNDLQIKADLEISRAYDYGNSGLLSGGTTKVFPMRFSDSNNYVYALAAELKRARNYRPIYTARGTLEQVTNKKIGRIAAREGLARNGAGPGESCAKPYSYAYFEGNELTE